MQNKSAFTFIEVMIAIVIFSIGILTVLKLVTNNLETMDKNNVKIQATLLAKEWIELAYNLRDSNIKKELSWNCLMNEAMYGRDKDELSNAIGRWDHSNFEEVICDWYFGIENNLQIWFSSENYVYYALSDKSDSFDINYEENKLYLYTGDVNYYGYLDVDERIGDNSSLRDGMSYTYFARYLSFVAVVEWDNILPGDKILKIKSHVLYKKWWNTWEVVFESFIWNY